VLNVDSFDDDEAGAMSLRVLYRADLVHIVSTNGRKSMALSSYERPVLDNFDRQGYNPLIREVLLCIIVEVGDLREECLGPNPPFFPTSAQLGTAWKKAS
jgi:hypothetical protein